MSLLLALLLAAVPEKGEGTIAVFGGARTLLPGNGDYLDAKLASHKVFQPGGFVAFGYQYDEDLHFKIEIGYLYDHYRVPGGDLEIKTIPILLALDTVLWRGPRFTLFAGGGLGYMLNTGTRGGSSNEANTTTGYVGVGLRVQLGGPVAALVEDRFFVASAQADPDPAAPRLTVGGNLLSVGLLFHFLEPEEKGHPSGH